MTTNYREILRLESLGLNKSDIASAAQCARNTVSTTLARAKTCGLQWPLPEGMSDKDLEEKLFPGAPGNIFSSWSTRCRITPTYTGRCSDRVLR